MNSASIPLIRMLALFLVEESSANSEHPVLIVSQLGALKARIHVTAKDRMDSISRIIDLFILLIYILRLII